MPGESQAVPNSLPDPSVIATEQMLRAIENLEKQTDLTRAGDNYLVQEQLAALRRELDERQNAIDIQFKAIEARHDERVRTQEKAVEVALAGVDKEFHEHIHQARVEASTALASTSKAIDKAEMSTSKAIDKAEAATDKRFEAVNEFRQQLNDQANTFMPRTEAIALDTNKQEKIDDVIGRLDALTLRFERGEGTSSGKEASWGYFIAIVATIGTLLGIIVVVANYVTSS